MRCYTTPALSATAYASVTHSHPPSTPAVRLYTFKKSGSLTNNLSSKAKVVHFIRHAEGTHNLNEEESKLPLHFDANLTPRGIEQCKQLARYTKQLNVDSVLVSPMTRCLETARISFPHLYDNENSDEPVPFIAHEEWRETVNFLCDSRRNKPTLEKTYSRVNFNNIQHDTDPIWEHYESIYGCYKTHTTKRESDDPMGLYNRSHSAWKLLLNRPEKNLALVGHSAFFMHNFMPYFNELKMLVDYGDDEVKELMTGSKFDNCELRSVVVDVPH